MACSSDWGHSMGLGSVSLRICLLFQDPLGERSMLHCS